MNAMMRVILRPRLKINCRISLKISFSFDLPARYFIFAGIQSWQNSPCITHSAKRQKLVRVARAADAADIMQKLTSSGFPTQIKPEPDAHF